MYSASPNSLGIIFTKKYMFYKMAAPYPVRQEDANPTRTGHPLALDSEIPLLAFCRANSSHRLCRMLRSPVASRFFTNILFAFEATRWRFSYRLSVRLRRTFESLFIHSFLGYEFCFEVDMSLII